MKNNKLKSVATLVRLLVLSVFVVFSISRFMVIRMTLKSIGEYRDLSRGLEKIPPLRLAILEQEATELRTEKDPTQSLEDCVLIVRNLLNAQGAKPGQFRITGKGKDAAAEFTISCPPLPFFTFLSELPESSIPALIYISIKPDPVSGNIKSTMRLVNVP